MDWTAIKDAVDYTADCIYDVINWLRPDAGGDTAVYWGGYVHGACWYYYNNNGNLVREDGTYTFNTNNDTAYVIASGEHVSYFLTLYDDTSLITPDISTQLPYYIGLSSSGRYRIKGMSNGISFLDAGTEFKLASPTNGSPKIYTSLGTASGSNFDFKMSGVPAVSTVSNISATIQIPEIYDKNVSYNDILILLVDKANDIAEQESISETFTIDDLPSWEEQQGTTEETEEGTGCCNCNITVDAEGNIYIDGTQIDLSVIAGAGAFGAGAVVNYGNVDINAGAFGAGAFGAGAVGYADVDVNGELNIGDISGEVTVGDISGSIDVSEISVEGNLEFSGDVNFDGSAEFSGDVNLNGGDINNNYTYNYTIESGAVLELPLNETDYQLDEIETDAPVLMLENIPVPEFPVEMVQTVPEVYNAGISFLSDVGLLSPFVGLSVVCFFIRAFRR